MIDFSLKEAHPLYRELIVEIYETLSETFPAAPLKKVHVYPQQAAKNCVDCSNRSLGDAITPKTINLNGYWFSQSPEVLISAGERDDFVLEIPNLRWHGGLPQPLQVLIHEYFHILQDGLGPDADKFAREMWLLTTTRKEFAITGYSLYNPSECWAECGAMLLLGENSNPCVQALGDFLQPFSRATNLAP